MRVIAGSRKGARIVAPKGDHTRPTGDRVREAIYNLVGPVDSASVLDLYAGSGALGIEALSRGAETCLFVESDRAACRVIQANLEKLALTGARVVCRDALGTLREEAAGRRTYDLVLVDPPYGQYSAIEMKLDTLIPSVLSDDGLLVVETDDRTQPSLSSLELITARKYGSTRVTVYAR